jgi:serine protease Do
MKYILRPFITIALAVMLGAAPGARAQSNRISQMLQKLDPLLTHNSQGYLGVLVTDVDNDSATKLKLKEVRGALITLIDHDAPAGQAGLRVNDVVLEVNGQRVEGAEQFGRMLKEMPAGRKVSLLIGRDGATQTLEVQLCDRKAMEQDVWNKLGHQSEGGSSAPTKGILPGTGDAGTPGFHMPFFGSSLNVGAMVEPLTPQTADVLGVQNGILVKQVARKSEAAAAGLKAHDVIIRVGNEAINTTSDWDRALRSNQNKPVQVTILRDGKQQVLNLQVDSKHNKSDVDYQDVFPGLLPDGPCPLMAALDPAWGTDAQAAADELREQAEEFRKNFNPDAFKIDPKEMEKFRQDMEQFGREFKADAFKIDPKQMEEFKHEMDELKRQMEEMRKSMPELFQFNQQQWEQFNRDMEQLQFGISRHA